MRLLRKATSNILLHKATSNILLHEDTNFYSNYHSRTTRKYSRAPGPDCAKKRVMKFDALE